MQIKYYGRSKFYQASIVDETDYSPIVYERVKKIQSFDELKQEGSEEATILKVLEVSRSNLYRWKKRYKEFGLAGLEDESKRPHNVRQPTWTLIVERRILLLRKEFPLWGKAKIAVLYKRRFNECISESTVGRVIQKLCALRKIMPVRFLYGKKDVKKRIFNGHAQRWRRGMKAIIPGELIQVDHMSITVPGHGELKHFNAICPVTKYSAYKIYQSATSKNAADFLEHIKLQFPFSIISIQVDGGSEFMADFELACSRNNIPLFVLPPRSPECNAHVERANGTAKYEFYSQYDQQPSFFMIQKNLQKFAYFYNKIRPHQGIGHLTPTQFYESIRLRP